MPVPLPPVVLVGSVRGGGHVGRPFTVLAPCPPPSHAFQLEGACVQQRLLERQERLSVNNSHPQERGPKPIKDPRRLRSFFSGLRERA